MPALVLASTSRYRRALLERLQLPFECADPGLDESAGRDELPAALASRLAEAKARAVAQARPADWVLGSDQVADLEGRRLGKPGDAATAQRQLAACSGRTVVFHTAWCLLRLDAGELHAGRDETRVRFRRLADDEIVRYIAAEQPLDCAGSFKCEGLGISLFEGIDNHDPTALVGLPLVAVSAALRRAGYSLP